MTDSPFARQALRSHLPRRAGLVLALVALCVMGAKVAFLGYQASDFLPRTRWDVELAMRFDGRGDGVHIRTFLPASDRHQVVVDESNASPGLHFGTEVVGLNRVGTWTGSQVPGDQVATYRMSVQTNRVRYQMPASLSVPQAYPSQVGVWLRPTETIQVDDPDIAAKLSEIGADRGSVAGRLRTIFDATAALEARPFKGTTDALTALRLDAASCNGKARLFVALSRAAGIPARLVGGIVLDRGQKRTSHQWAEAYVSGHWVPFCPTNGYFAELPASYLALYRGDEVLFEHTSEINFDYAFAITSTSVPTERAQQALGPANLWALFRRLGLPFALLRTILMLPVGALVVVFFRNVVGLPTFGTFLPALIAAAAGATGVAWGMMGLLVVILLAVSVRALVQYLRLLHSPGLAILLAGVSGALLATSLAADRLGLGDLARIVLFPIAVQAIAAERFFLALAENGWREATSELAGTIVVILACYLMMNSLALQLLVLGFPEVLLIVVAADVYLGRWVGLRLSEYRRFRTLLAWEGP